MHIHTDVIGYTQQIQNALEAEKDSGRIAPHVTFKSLEPHGSKSHAFAFEIQLEGHEHDNGRKLGNSGSYGAGENYAATYDEWGWFLAALYSLDPTMVVGSAKNPIYSDEEQFHEKTGWTYSPGLLLPLLEAGDDPYPYVFGRAGKGREGYGRSDGNYIWGRLVAPTWWRSPMADAYRRFQNGEKQGNHSVKYLPRTADAYRAFAHIEKD